MESGVIVGRVPGEVDGPGAGLPLSHLVVVLDRRRARVRKSNPVHDLVIIRRVVDGALRPRFAPVRRLLVHKASVGNAPEDWVLVAWFRQGDGSGNSHS